jgi:Fe2+ or Zn2+ uptake regulation protein
MDVVRDLHTQVSGRLADREVRYTKARRAVVQALQRARGPQSAADLHRGLRESVPLSSLYRCLSVLDEAGVLRKQHDAGGVARFELAEWLLGHHHHLICRVCGSVEDFEMDGESEAALADLAARAALTSGYRVDGHVLEVEGTCGDCRS